MQSATSFHNGSASMQSATSFQGGAEYDQDSFASATASHVASELLSSPERSANEAFPVLSVPAPPAPSSPVRSGPSSPVRSAPSSPVHSAPSALVPSARSPPASATLPVGELADALVDALVDEALSDMLPSSSMPAELGPGTRVLPASADPGLKHEGLPSTPDAAHFKPRPAMPSIVVEDMPVSPDRILDPTVRPTAALDISVSPVPVGHLGDSRSARPLSPRLGSPDGRPSSPTSLSPVADRLLQLQDERAVRSPQTPEAPSAPVAQGSDDDALLVHLTLQVGSWLRQLAQ